MFHQLPCESKGANAIGKDSFLNYVRTCDLTKCCCCCCSSSSSSASSSSSSSSLAYGLYSLTSASFCFLPSSLDTHRFQIILNSLATLILVIQQNRAKKFTANYSVSRTQCTIFKGVSEIDLFKD